MATMLPLDTVPTLPPALSIPSARWPAALDELRHSPVPVAAKWLLAARDELSRELHRIKLQQRRMSRVAPIVQQCWQARRDLIERRLDDLARVKPGAMPQRGRSGWCSGAGAVAKARRATGASIS